MTTLVIVADSVRIPDRPDLGAGVLVARNPTHIVTEWPKAEGYPPCMTTYRIEMRSVGLDVAEQLLATPLIGWDKVL